MNRCLSILLSVCLVALLLCGCPAACAEEEGYGCNMVVVNCNDWVSLREMPSTHAEQLVKVPLGAVVTRCVPQGEEWIYAAYNGQQGYILSKYLRQCEDVSLYSAMLVNECTDFSETMDSTEADVCIPEGTIVRNCIVYSGGQASVEYGSRRVYVTAGNLTPYPELSHFPRQMTLHWNNAIFAEDYQAPELDLKIGYTEDFDLTAYRYTEYDYTAASPVDEDIPKVRYVLYTDSLLKHVHLFSVSIRCIDDETGEEVIDTTLEETISQLDPEHPLAVTAVMYGDMPNLAVGYEDLMGAYHFAFVDMSGEDGSLYLSEF